jgi:hypothetical protein
VEWLAADARQAETLHAAGPAGAEAIVCIESDDLRTLAWLSSTPPVSLRPASSRRA